MGNSFFIYFIRILVVLTALPIHEYAHGLIAKKMGDDTAYFQGRLTLNPLAHIDIVGAICLIFTGFGWAKPVPINPYRFKNYKAGMALSALAGPVSNIILATVLMVIYKILYLVLAVNTFTISLLYIFQIMIITNLNLAVFNLLPIPPLDGSKIFGVFLPNKIYNKMLAYQSQISIIFFAVLFFSNTISRLTGFDILFPLSWLVNVLYTAINYLTGFVDIIAGLI